MANSRLNSSLVDYTGRIFRLAASNQEAIPQTGLSASTTSETIDSEATPISRDLPLLHMARTMLMHCVAHMLVTPRRHSVSKASGCNAAVFDRLRHTNRAESYDKFTKPRP